MNRIGRVALLIAGAAFAAAASAAAPVSVVVVRKPGSGAQTRMSDALVRALARANTGDARVIDLSGDGVADAARVAREASGTQVVFAVGPDAVVAVGEGAHAHVIALGVPNPARLRTMATYVSVYPKGERIFEFASRRLGAKRIGFLYSPAHNREVAASFEKIAAGRGLAFVPMPASSPGELVRVLKDGLPRIDVLLLPVDPLLFDRMSLRLIVERSAAAHKPTIGFLTDLTPLGVMASLVADPDAVTAAAIREAGLARPAQRKQVEVDAVEITVSRRAAEMIGINVESLGADKIQ